MQLTSTEAESVTWLNYTAAAERIGRGVHVVERFHRQGMPMQWRVDDAGWRERIVDERVLLRWARAKARTAEHLAVLGPEPALDASPALPEDPFDRSEDSEGVLPFRAPVDPLESMKPLRGAAEYGLLLEAMKTEQAGCSGVDEFTAEQVDDETAVVLASICRECPLLEECRAFAVRSRPDVGFWA